MKIREFFAGVMRVARRSPGDSGPLVSATYRLEVPPGWRIEEAGKVASIRGPRGELFQVSSAASSASDADALVESKDALQKAARRALESLLREPELTLLEGPTENTTSSGFPYEEVLLQAPNGDLVAGFTVHGPRTSIIATLDAALDHSVVNSIRESVHSISFESSP